MSDVPWLPVTLDEEMLHEFRRPFTPEAVRWKIQSAWKSGKGAFVVAYIDARLVIERLNHVTALWSDEYAVVAPNTLRCDLTVCGVTRRDVGVGQGNDDGMRMKGAYSDALKRAGVKFGIGVSIYAMKAPSMRVGSGDGELRTYKKGDGEDAPTLDDRSEGWLRERYRAWLDAKGVDAFGEPLDHGDQESPVGDPDVMDVPSGVPGDASEATRDAQLGPNVAAAAQDLRDAFSAYQSYVASLTGDERMDLEAQGRVLLPGEFGRLTREAQAGCSEEDIGPLVELQARVEAMTG
jgi:Rad52/22 family double-strand break repair protein